MSSTLSFADLGVPADMIAGLKARGITAPFPIQAATIADALAGHDVCGRAPTGSGKTLAFGVPVVLAATNAAPRRPKALVLAPTRELAAQIASELTLLGTTTGCRVASFYGGVGFGPQLDALRRGIDVAVACPGRLIDLLERGALRLDQVGVVVVDEADRMADMGFLPAVRQLLDQVSSDRQTLLYSATLDGDVKELIRRYQHNPRRHELDSPEDAIGEGAEHLFWRTEASDRLALATRIVAVHQSAMVFCRTKRGADRLAKQLKLSGISVGAIHGDRSQAQRDQALEAFRAQHLQVLVGTDVAARGIHVEGVDCVVHFDPPEDEKAYVHRSGRTGRAGAGGTVISLVTKEHTGFIRKLQSNLRLASGVHDPDEQLLSSAPTFVRRPPKPLSNSEVSSRPTGSGRRSSGGSTRRSSGPRSGAPRSGAPRSGAPRTASSRGSAPRSGATTRGRAPGQGNYAPSAPVDGNSRSQSPRAGSPGGRGSAQRPATTGNGASRSDRPSRPTDPSRSRRRPRRAA